MSAHPSIGSEITALIRGEFFVGVVEKQWLDGFTSKRTDTGAVYLHHYSAEGVTWMRGVATLADRMAMKAAVALRGSS